MDNPHKLMENMIIISKYVGIYINKLQNSLINFACITMPTTPLVIEDTKAERMACPAESSVGMPDWAADVRHWHG
jgi:hypothetical protein